MTKNQSIQKLVEKLEKSEPFVVLSMDEYEDLIMFADPEFKEALKEAENDAKAGRIVELNKFIENEG